MSDPAPPDGGTQDGHTQDGGVIRVDTDQVAGVIGLDDLVARVRDGAAARAAQARAGAANPTADHEALDRISALAAQLADELARIGPLDG